MRIFLNSMIASTKMLDRSDVVVTISIARGTAILMEWAMNAQANYRWVAPPGGELIFDSKPIVTAQSDQIPQLRCRVQLDSLEIGKPPTHMTILITKRDSPYRSVHNRSD